LSIRLGNVEAGVGMLVVGVAIWIQVSSRAAAQRRDPNRVIFVKLVRELNPLIDIGQVGEVELTDIHYCSLGLQEK
jgi:hypothetical protein